MRKLTLCTFIVIFLFSNIGLNVHAAIPEPPKVSADGVVLMDGNNGQILYQKNMDASYPPASTTKIMTALLTLEHCKLTDKVKVSDDFVSKYKPLRDGNSALRRHVRCLYGVPRLASGGLCSELDAAESVAWWS